MSNVDSSQDLQFNVSGSPKLGCGFVLIDVYTLYCGSNLKSISIKVDLCQDVTTHMSLMPTPGHSSITTMP